MPSRNVAPFLSVAVEPVARVPIDPLSTWQVEISCGRSWLGDRGDKKVSAHHFVIVALMQELIRLMPKKGWGEEWLSSFGSAVGE